MHIFFKEFYLSMVLAAHYLSSNSVTARAEGGGLLSEKWVGVDSGREGVENWQKCADILYGCSLQRSVFPLTLILRMART